MVGKLLGVSGIIVDKISVSRAEESGAMWLVAWQYSCGIQPPPSGRIHD